MNSHWSPPAPPKKKKINASGICSAGCLDVVTSWSAGSGESLLRQNNNLVSWRAKGCKRFPRAAQADPLS